MGIHKLGVRLLVSVSVGVSVWGGGSLDIEGSQRRGSLDILALKLVETSLVIKGSLVVST